VVAIAYCTVTGKCVPVLEASIKAYAPPDTRLYFGNSPKGSFGESYNALLEWVFEREDEVVISNDDVVLTPSTMQLLMEDVQELKAKHGDKLGFVATYADDVRAIQNIQFNRNRELKHNSLVSPLFAWMSKAAFEAAKFPPLNWYSDDVICEDLNRKGFHHYVSRAYVHHAGSQTIGTDHAALNAAARPWLRANRPAYMKDWFGA
jgi:GR25 family glycosyltransferase involved in LPS biosynthesis